MSDSDDPVDTETVPGVEVEEWVHTQDASTPTRQVSSIPGTELPIVPEHNEIASLAQMATTLCAADAVPAALRNKPNDTFLVLLTARDLGVSLTTAIREFHVIDGKVTCSPKVRAGMVRAAGLGRLWPDPNNNEDSAIWYAVRADDPDHTHSSTFSMRDAGRVNAKENGKNIKLNEKSTWRQYPQRMLSWRALGYLLDDVFPEVGTGLYSPDEMGAITDENGDPIIDVTATEAFTGMREPRGRQSQQPPDPAADPAEIEALRARIDKIKEVPAAAQALMDEWTKRPDMDAPISAENPARLPPLAKLLARHLPVATALVKSIEDRIEAVNGPDSDPSPDVGEDASDTPGDQQGQREAASDRDLDPQLVAIADEVKAMRIADVVLALGERNLPVEGNEQTQRMRLTEARYREEHTEPVDDHQGLRDRLEAMTKRELVAACVVHFVQSTGTKAELVDRLDQYLTEQGWEPGQPIIDPAQIAEQAT